tara:strand:+ start:194 stop:340 length:147 start_codon:yes stop_codon:yes gene_type:complete
MLAELVDNANSILWHQQQALGHVNTERPDVQATKDCLCVLALFDQIKL